MNTSLEVKEDGQIWLIPDCPQEPTIIEIVGLPRGPSRFKQRLAYETALASAPRYLVSNQEVAKTILLKAHRIEIDLDPIEFTVGIYPIPDLKWRKKERPCEDSGTDDQGRKVDFEWVAVIK